MAQNPAGNQNFAYSAFLRGLNQPPNVQPAAPGGSANRTSRMNELQRGARTQKASSAQQIALLKAQFQALGAQIDAISNSAAQPSNEELHSISPGIPATASLLPTPSHDDLMHNSAYTAAFKASTDAASAVDKYTRMLNVASATGNAPSIHRATDKIQKWSAISQSAEAALASQKAALTAATQAAFANTADPNEGQFSSGKHSLV